MLHVIPILRIFDYNKAVEFYISWLGFRIDWEHRFSENSPVYMQLSREHILLHLSEHHGDASPGAKVYIQYHNLKNLHALLNDKKYKFNKPGMEEAPWNAWCMEVVDPFYNKLLFCEDKNQLAK
jgi:hypothetical protein